MSKASGNPPLQKIGRESAFSMALSRQRAGNTAEAIRIYQQILAANADFAPAWINCGVALRILGQFDASIVYLQRGIALKPEDAGALSNLGNALRAAGRRDESH